MSIFHRIMVPLSCLVLVSCGQNSMVPMQTYSNSAGGLSAITSAMIANSNPRRAITSNQVNTLYSGSTGSPNVNTSISSAGLSMGSPALGMNLFGLSNQTSATDPQQCVNNFSRYPHFSANYDTALAELATCLNQVMITQNPTLFQQYRTLQQTNYGYY